MTSAFGGQHSIQLSYGCRRKFGGLLRSASAITDTTGQQRTLGYQESVEKRSASRCRRVLRSRLTSAM